MEKARDELAFWAAVAAVAVVAVAGVQLLGRSELGAKLGPVRDLATLLAAPPQPPAV